MHAAGAWGMGILPPFIMPLKVGQNVTRFLVCNIIKYISSVSIQSLFGTSRESCG